MKDRHVTRGVAALSCAILLGLALVSCSRPSSKTQATTIKIGAVLPLTGPLAYIAQQLENGMNLAMSQVNAAGGVNGKKMELEVQDNLGSASNSVSAFRALLQRDPNLQIVISTHSPLSLPLRPLAEQDHVLLVATVVSYPAFTKGYHYVLRDFVSSRVESAMMAKFLVTEKKVTTAAVLYVGDDYGRGAFTDFSNTFDGLGGKIVASDQFEQSASDFRSIIAKALVSKPAAVYIVGRERSLAAALVQLKESGYSGIVATTISLNAETVLKQGGKALDGVYFTDIRYFPDNPQDAKTRDFVREYKAKYGDPHNYVAVYGYDIIHYLANAIAKGGYSADGVRRALVGAKLSLVRGDVTVPTDLDIQTPLRVVQVQGGKFVSVYPPTN